MTKKQKDLAVISLMYLFSFAVAQRFCVHAVGEVWRYLIFDIAATVVVFVFSVLWKNSSVYDAYWSLTPMIMCIQLFGEHRAFTGMRLLFLAAFLLWSVRLTMNWVVVFTDFSYEDWRYRKYRAETPALFWPAVNFFGIHLMPTLLVFAGMLPIFVLVDMEMDMAALPGILLMVTGTALEHFSDRQMHSFLASGQQGVTCRSGLWARTRHPNYLGEITFWVGVFVTMLPFAPARWYLGVGALLIALLFNFISIPMMEKRQMARRADYAEYQQETPRLMLRFFR